MEKNEERTQRNPLDWEYELKVEKLLKLKELDKTGKINLKFLDKVGFDLTPSIPYGWQEKAETIVLKSGRSKKLADYCFPNY